MRNVKKWLVVFVGTAALLVSGCYGDTQTVSDETQVSQTSPEGEEQIFTDSLGREVSLPEELSRVAPSGNLSQMILYSLAPDTMVGFSSDPGESMSLYFSEEYKELPVFGTFYGKNADLNKEVLIAAQPQVVIDMGEIKENMAEDLDSLQKQLGIPVIFIEAELESTGDAYRTLGEILHREEEAEVLAQYCDTAVAQAREKAASIPEEERVTVYYGEGTDGLSANPKGSFHTEVIDLVGGINIAEIGDSGKGENQVSLEQMFLWDPDVLLFTGDGAYQTVAADDSWRDLKAVQNHRYYEIPEVPYNWIDRPPAVNRIIGIKWLGNLLYPEVFQYDMVKEAQEFYRLFYRYELSEEEAKELMSHSTFAEE